MRTVSISEPYEGHGMKVKAGVRYVVEDTTLARWLNLGIVDEISPLHDTSPPYKPGYHDKAYISRAGGFGDLLFLTPVIRAFQQQGVYVSVCCLEQYKDALSGVPGILWMPYPMEFERWRGFYNGPFISLEGVVEFSKTPEVYMADLFAQAAGVELTCGRHLSFEVSEEARQWAAQTHPRKCAKRVGIQTVASVPIRSYPHEHMVEVIKTLVLRGDLEVCLFGSPKGIKVPANSHPRITYVTETAKTFMQSAGVMESCDVFLGPDSSLVHVAGALKIPTVALYGPFPWQARTAHAESIRALSGDLPCAPCYWHGRKSMWPAHGPCSKTGKCEALAMIEPKRLVREIERKLEAGV